jgi:hypothetical protein
MGRSGRTVLLLSTEYNLSLYSGRNMRTKKDIQQDFILETNSYEAVSSESRSELTENTVAMK